MSGGTPIYTATWAYNAASLLTSASDTYSAYAYTYNSDNSVTQVDNNSTPTGPHVVLNIGYDNLNRKTSESATVAGTADYLNNYAYDAASQLTQITQQGQSGGNSVAAKRVDYTYTSIGAVSTIDRYANLAGTQLVDTSTYGYDAAGKPTSLSEDKGGTNFASYTWTYDNMGRLTADTIGSASDGYTYDAASQLTAATHSGGGNESYSYDSNGNRTNTGYSTGTNNQLSSDGTYNYTYDNEGNLTQKTTISTGAYVTYTWDYRNRLTDVKAYNSSNVLQSHVNYIYDIRDRLIEKQLDPTGGGTYTSKQDFAYSGTNPVLVYNGSGTLTDRLLVVPPSGGSEHNTLADENGSGTVSWFLKDREGTTNDVIQYNSGTNTTTVVDHLTYNSFGKITAQTNSAYQPIFAYTGQMWDADASLYWYHARWYDPAVGRFISRDPMSFVAGDHNLYRYVNNNAPNFTDPTGFEADPNEFGPGALPSTIANNVGEGAHTIILADVAKAKALAETSTDGTWNVTQLTEDIQAWPVLAQMWDDINRRNRVELRIVLGQVENERAESYIDQGLIIIDPRCTLALATDCAIFEMHNHYRKRDFDDVRTLARRGQLTADAWDKLNNRIEYQNALHAYPIVKNVVRLIDPAYVSDLARAAKAKSFDDWRRGFDSVTKMAYLTQWNTNYRVRFEEEQARRNHLLERGITWPMHTWNNPNEGPVIPPEWWAGFSNPHVSDPHLFD